MNANFYDCTVANRTKNHIKVPEFQVNSLGNEIIKAKRIQVSPIHQNTRSVSASRYFRAIFRVPRSDKENSHSKAHAETGKTENEIRYRSACRRGEVQVNKNERETNRTIPRIKIFKLNNECIQKNSKKTDELVTFRPDATAIKRGFPRDVFCIETRRKLN